MEKYRVCFTYKIIDKENEDYGVLREEQKEFDYYVDALTYSRQVANSSHTEMKIVNLPYIEPVD